MDIYLLQTRCYGEDSFDTIEQFSSLEAAKLDAGPDLEWKQNGANQWWAEEMDEDCEEDGLPWRYRILKIKTSA